MDKALFEVLLILNGCCEPWRGQIEHYLKSHVHDLNIRFVQTDVPGVSNARNKGLDIAQGDYITFLDDDDYVSPKYLELLYAKANSETIALAYPFAFYDGTPHKQLSPKQYKITGTYNCLYSFGKQPYQKARKYFSGPCMKLIHKDIIHGCRFDTNFKNGEDGLFMFLISNRFKQVDFAEKDCIYYRRYREKSAMLSLDFKNRSTICLQLMREYFNIYRNGKDYHFGFFITRELGAIHTILTH